MTQPPRSPDPNEAADALMRRAERLQAIVDSTRGMINAISEAIYVQDRQGRFLDVNDGAVRMYGHPREFFIGKTPEVLSAPGRNNLEQVAQCFQRVLQGEPQQFEFWGLRRDGTTFPKNVRLYPGSNLGEPVVIAVAQDVTGRKRSEKMQGATYGIAEAALKSRDTEELFQRIHALVRELMPADNFYYAAWDQDTDTVSFPYWVDEVDPVPEPRRLRRGLTEYVLHTGRPLLVDEEAMLRLEASGEVESFGTFSIDWLGVPLQGESSVLGALVVQNYAGGYRYTPDDRDLLVFVSSQVAMAIERTRAETEQRIMTAAMDMAADPVLGIGASGQFVFVNRAACSMLGWTAEELLRLSIWDINPERTPEGWPERWKRTRSRGSNREETHYRRRDGALVPVEISSSFLAHEGREVIFTNVRDISSRKAAEAALRYSEDKFSKAFHASPDAINLTRLDDGTYLDVSEGFEKLVGWTRSEAIGRSSLDLNIWADPADRQRVIDLIKGQGEYTSLELRFRKKDGSLLTGMMSGKIMEVDGIPCLLSITRDITDRKKAEEALAAERGLFIGGPVMVFKWRGQPSGPVEYASPNVESILGYRVADLLAGTISFQSLIHPEDLPRLHREFALAETRGLLHFEQHYRLRTATGEHRWFYAFSNATGGEPRPSHFLGYLLDITDSRHAEDALRQSQKLESLGILAGGIAHDFNNLLTVVLGNLNLAQMHLPDGSRAQPYLANMEATVIRATELTKQMLAYSGRGHFLVKPQDLNGVVREVAHLLEVSISKKIRLHFELDPGVPAIRADSAQIQQVVMNLVTNASDAIGDREGTIHLSTSSAYLDQQELLATYRSDALSPGTYVFLEVSDNGVGMTSEVMARIFDPFYTTKATGRGLGLSAMLGILRGHGAGLRLTSEVGRGSSFRICFPASQEQPASVPPAAEQSAARPLRGRILLVDDEELILQTIGAALKSMGLEVLTAGDGAEALVQFRLANPPLDLVLMDLTMPRMDGREAFQAMHELNPAIPVVLSSGFSQQDSIQTLTGEGPAAFIQKPYQLKELRRVLRGLLEG